MFFKKLQLVSNTLDSFVRKLIANNFQIFPSLVTLELSNKKIKSFCMLKSCFPTLAKEAKKFPQKISFLLLKIVKNSKSLLQLHNENDDRQVELFGGMRERWRK